jgi:hypothetical protein
MPFPIRLEEQIYETMRAGKEVLFTFTTGGVKYEAVFQHKEARYVTLFSNSCLVLNKESDRRVGVSRSKLETRTFQPLPAIPSLFLASRNTRHCRVWCYEIGSMDV